MAPRTHFTSYFLAETRQAWSEKPATRGDIPVGTSTSGDGFAAHGWRFSDENGGVK